MNFEGIITPMLTPFDSKGNINVEVTNQFVNKLIDGGVNGLFILGTNGEFHTMNDEEKIELAKATIKAANKRVPVYVGVGGNSTQNVIDLAKTMEVLGADALSVITPYFLIPSDQEIIDHYKSIAASVKLPIILYNIPKNTGVCLTPEIVRELADIENIVAIKDSSGKMENILAYLEAGKDKEMDVLVGSDSIMLKAFQAGAVGAIAGTSNILVDLDVRLFQNFKEGNMEEATRLQGEIEVLRVALKLGTVPSVLKKAVELTGIDMGAPRLPVKECDEEVTSKIKEMLEYYKL